MNYFPVGGSIGKLPCVYNGVEKKIKGVRIEKAPFFEADRNKRPLELGNVSLKSYSFSFHHNNETYAVIYCTEGDSNYHNVLMKLDIDKWIKVNVGVSFDYAVSHDGKIHLFRWGSSKKHYILDGEILTELTPLPSSYERMSAGSFAGKLHIFGGYSTSYYSDATHYNTWRTHCEWDGETWTSTKSLPDGVCGAGVVVMGDLLYLLGGKQSSGDTYLSDADRCYILNANGTWSVGNSVAGLIHMDGSDSFGLAFTFDNTVMLFGRGKASTPSSGYYTDFYSLTPNGWVLTSRLYRKDVNLYDGLVVAEDDCIKILHEKTPAIFVNDTWHELYSNQDFVAIPIFN